MSPDEGAALLLKHQPSLRDYTGGVEKLRNLSELVGGVPCLLHLLGAKLRQDKDPGACLDQALVDPSILDQLKAKVSIHQDLPACSSSY